MRQKISFAYRRNKKGMNVESMIQHAQACEHTVSRSCTRQHAVARGCRTPLHCCPSVACSPAVVMETKFFLGFEPAVGSVSAVANISQYQSASEFNMISPNAVCRSSSFLVDPFSRFCQPNAQISRNQNCPRTDVLKSRDCLENAVTLSGTCSKY